MEFHLCQILGQGEQHRGLKRGGHGLAGFHVPRKDDAVNGGMDDRFCQIRLVGFESGLGLGHLRPCGGLGGLCPMQRRLSRIQVVLRRHHVIAQFPHLL